MVEKQKSSVEQVSTQKELGNLRREITDSEREKMINQERSNYISMHEKIRTVDGFNYVDGHWNTIRLSAKSYKWGQIYEITINKKQKGWLWSTSQYTLRRDKDAWRRDFELVVKDSNRTEKRRIRGKELDDVLSNFNKRYGEASNKKNSRENSLASNDQNDANDILNNIENWNLA